MVWVNRLKKNLYSNYQLDDACLIGDHTLNPGLKPNLPYRKAAVLVPVFTHNEKLLFTIRTRHLKNHAGQISFPGGAMEKQDKDPVETALRETEEEVGIQPHEVKVAGFLNSYLTRTGFLVVPVVGLIEQRSTLRPDPFEVEDVFEVPFSYFLESEHRKSEKIMYKGKARQYYAYSYKGKHIWGATAGMLSNMVEILNHGPAQKNKYHNNP